MRYLHPAAMIAYLIFSGISFVVILFSVCRNCFYYGRRCYMLLGLLAGLILKKGDMKLYRPHSRVVWPFLLGLLFIPLCTATMILIIRYSNIMLLWLIANVMGVAALVIAARYSTCPHCRMQGLCPFCIAKKRLKAEEAQLLPTGLYH
jgi:nicotinamide riboside transporter PnuC